MELRGKYLNHFSFHCSTVYCPESGNEDPLNSWHWLQWAGKWLGPSAERDFLVYISRRYCGIWYLVYFDINPFTSKQQVWRTCSNCQEKIKLPLWELSNQTELRRRLYQRLNERLSPPDSWLCSCLIIYWLPLQFEWRKVSEWYFWYY